MASIRTGIELNDGFSKVIYSLINAVNLAVSSMADMQSTMAADIDTSSIDGARNSVNDATIALDNLVNKMQEANAAGINPQIDIPSSPLVNTDPTITVPQVETPTTSPTPVRPNAPPDPVTVPLEWDVQDIPVFTGTGVERYQQEVASANAQLEKLIETQTSVEGAASALSILPDDAIADITSMSARIRALSSQIEQISQVNVGDEASNQIEQLRGQLNQAIRAQQSLNTAMADGDASGIVESYNQLNSTISSTERYIRDNTNEQGQFNSMIQDGTQKADRLAGMIRSAVGAYMSIQGLKNAIDISDGLISTTARLNSMNESFNKINGTAMETDSLVKQIYASAQNARGSFGDMAAVVAKFGNNARDAFSSQDEVVAFANIVQKQMTIAGASTQEASNALLQLSQALGSGVLRGDELNSIFEQAPNLIQSIADYLDVPIGQIRTMASEGKLSADVVKASIFASADAVNAKFEEMPMTWSQAWQSMKNTALMAFQPVLNRINELVNSANFQNFANGAIQAMAIVANQVLNIFDLIGSVAQFISDNWSVIEPLIMGAATALGIYTAAIVAYNTAQAISNGLQALAAFQETVHAAASTLAAGATFAQTVAQYGLNAALAACPITWIVLAFIALVAIIYAVCSAIARMTGVASSGLGVICGAVNVAIAFIRNIVIGLINTIIAQAVNLYNLLANFAAAFGTLFNNPVAAIKAVMLSLFNFIVGVVSKAAAMLDAVFGSNLAGAVAGFQGKIQSEIDATIETAGGTAAQTLNAEDYMIDRVDYGDAFNAGAVFGDGIADKIAGFDLASVLGATELPDTSDFDMSDVIANGINNSGLGDASGTTADNTGKIASSVSASEEDLKYLRDMAEQETVNRYTLASVNVDMTGMTNNVNNGMDLDGVVNGLTEAVDEAIENMAEGVHD